MKNEAHFVSKEFTSNCFVEAVKAKTKDKKVKIYFCMPRITENKNFQMVHFMWSDGTADYDFSDNQERNLPWYKCFWFRGRIRKFRLGFGKQYSQYRNGR